MTVRLVANASQRAQVVAFLRSIDQTTPRSRDFRDLAKRPRI